VLAVTGPLARVRWCATSGRPGSAGRGGRHLPRQIRIGGAFDGESAARLPLTIAVDADLQRYDGPAASGA
jgi:hypothetical protein